MSSPDIVARILAFGPRSLSGGPDELFEQACSLETRDPAAAREAYRRVLGLDPRHSDAHLNLGRLLHEEGDLAGAEAHYAMALAAGARATAAFNLGIVLEDLDRPREAQHAYEQALALDPRCADAHYNLALLHERLGSRAEAFQHLLAYKRLTTMCA